MLVGYQYQLRKATFLAEWPRLGFRSWYRCPFWRCYGLMVYRKQVSQRRAEYVANSRLARQLAWSCDFASLLGLASHRTVRNSITLRRSWLSHSHSNNGRRMAYIVEFLTRIARWLVSLFTDSENAESELTSKSDRLQFFWLAVRRFVVDVLNIRTCLPACHGSDCHPNAPAPTPSTNPQHKLHDTTPCFFANRMKFDHRKFSSS